MFEEDDRHPNHLDMRSRKCSWVMKKSSSRKGRSSISRGAILSLEIDESA